MTIKKSDFAKHINRRFGFPASMAGEIVTVIFQEIIESLKRGEPVKIANFGTFGIHEKKEREGRNPKTGKPAMISARRVPTFRASDNFRSKISPEG
ncbi:MAG: integration host factor subunit alpha [Rickettsiales bacterium]|jgi:integration host factor subunit alpha|nr:integration host factor subunit alpha [Rickettsiales bacterium]